MKKVKLSDERQIKIAEELCKKLGIDIKEDDNVWTMASFIDFDSIQEEAWL